MSTVEAESETVTVETVNSVTLSRDPEGNLIFHCPQNDDDEVDSGENLEPPQKRFCFPDDDESADESAPCISVVAISENDQSFEMTMTASAEVANDDLNEETVAQVQILQNEQSDDLSPTGNEEVMPVSQAWFTTKEDKDSLTNKGHKWKKGMWSKEEIDLLMCNIDRYLKARGMTDASEIIFEMSKDERKDFYRTIAWGLNRPLFAVYRRVLRMYDDTNHVGKYTPEEILRLRELRIKHGNDWATIGAALGRSACSVKDRCRLMKETCNRGKWTEDEERRLAEVVHNLTATDPGDAVTQGVSWASVAERVGSRSEKQCRSKWLNYLNWKQSGGTEWTKEDEMALILRITELDVLDENDINWDILAEGWSSVRSPQWLRSKWWTVKRQIANHKDVSFPVLIKGLRHLHETQNQLSGQLASEKKLGTGFYTNSNAGVQHVQIRLTRLDENSVFPQSPMGALQIPVQITHVSSTDSPCAGDSDAITLNSSTLQTFELLPSFHLQPTTTPGTFLLQTSSNQGIPLTLTSSPTMGLAATASPASQDQILVHSLSPDTLLNDSVQVQCHTPVDEIASTVMTREGLSIGPEQQVTLTSNQNTLDADPFPGEIQPSKLDPMEHSTYGMDQQMDYKSSVELLQHLVATDEDIANPDHKQEESLHRDLTQDLVSEILYCSTMKRDPILRMSRRTKARCWRFRNL
ncbi:cyclin-D-binding Myb-like transcription factor 1 isoform X1 [Ambystoma mexicanum]|uniref:cyclin-D-binding Myb-like transcription factor 1 isoform X1 n=1 Tax=Ambystoma mexicanum TaxID=8296 RepID=UPI0037E82EDB